MIVGKNNYCCKWFNVYNKDKLCNSNVCSNGIICNYM